VCHVPRRRQRGEERRAKSFGHRHGALAAGALRVDPDADGVEATLAAKEIDELVKQPISLMPADLANALSAQELADVVAWLETLRATN